VLATLAFRIPHDRIDHVLGHVTAYPFTEEFAQAWDRLPRIRLDSGRSGTPKYASLAAALRAVTACPVRLFGSWDLSEAEQVAGARALLLTTAPINPRLLHNAVNAWEYLVRKDQDLRTLTPVLPSAPELPRSFGTFLDLDGRRAPRAPGWVFEAAAWQVMRRLGAHSLELDGRSPIAFRLDTDGDLLAWDDLVTNVWSDRTGYGMARVTCKIVTIAGLSDLVLRFDAHLTRLDQRWNGVKNAWVERDKAGLPVLRVAVRSMRTQDGTWSTMPQDHTAEVVEACGLERLTLEPVLPDTPGRVRAIVPRARRHPVGKGLGARFLLRLAEHIQRTLPDLVPLHYEQDTIRLPRRMTDPIAREAVPYAVHAAGFERLRVVCLYQSAAARKRMSTRLDDLAAGPAATVADGDEHQISERLSVVFHRTPELIAHGRHERQPLLDQLSGLNGNDALTAAWVETVWNPTLRVDDDAKHQLRRLLAARGMVSQFLATDPPEVTGRKRRSAAALRHASASALRDLLRGAGVVDHRVANAAAADDLVARLDQPAILVGIHARLQQSGGNGKPRLVVRVVALYADGDPTACWPIKMYSDTYGWRPYAPALADFHAGPIGSTEHGRRGAKAEATRLYVASILDALDPGLPVIIFTDAGATRTIWPGIQNGSFCAGALPGDNLLAAGRDVAIVRCNANDEVPRPAHRVRGGRRPGDPLKPATPARRIYRLVDSREAVWLLPGASRVYRSMGGDAGARYTRWTLPADLAHLRGDDWHGFTGTEIAIVQAGTRDPLALAALTARLCDQAVAWDDRTRLPTPLHLGVAADQDHPDYRTPDYQLDDGSSN
jgi:RNaseH domain of pPIWI_RE/pPIWI_RE module N-terminal domain/MID domain of pPIWI_RE